MAPTPLSFPLTWHSVQLVCVHTPVCIYLWANYVGLLSSASFFSLFFKASTFLGPSATCNYALVRCWNISFPTTLRFFRASLTIFFLSCEFLVLRPFRLAHPIPLWDPFLPMSFFLVFFSKPSKNTP